MKPEKVVVLYSPREVVMKFAEPRTRNLEVPVYSSAPPPDALSRKYVSDLIEEYGPFLPYTLLFGLPEPQREYPLWANLLQKGLRGFGFFAETGVEAWHLAAPAMESLVYTSRRPNGRPNPKRIQFLMLSRYGGGRPRYFQAFWQGIYGRQPDWAKVDFLSAGQAGVNGASHTAHMGSVANIDGHAGWERVQEEFRRRQREDVRGPTHWMVLFAGVHEALPAFQGLEEFLAEGPRYAMWPVVVDAYANWSAWQPYLKYLGLQVFGPWKRVHEPVRHHLREILLQDRPEMLLDLHPGTALLLSRRRGHAVYQVPIAETVWRRLWLTGTERDREVVELEPVPERVSVHAQVPPARTTRSGLGPMYINAPAGD